MHAHSGVSMSRSDLKSLSACSLFNSEQDRVLLLYPVAIFSICSVVLLSRTASPPLAVIAITVKIQICRMTMIGQGDGGRSGLETFLGTMNHRFSTSGNRTKHMPISYLSLWVQPRSLTSGDLSWPWYSSGAMPRVTSSHVLTPISSTIPIQVNRTTPSCVYSRFRWYLVEGCSSYDVIFSWPDLNWPNCFHQKLRKGCAP